MAEEGTGLSLSEQLREKFEEGVVTGRYPPGTRLDELALAAEYGVSRTPVREALLQLSAAGFVERRQRKGWEVANVPPTRLCEMFEVMAELEAMCARLAARRATDGDHQRIYAAHDACRGAVVGGDSDTYFRCNEGFHFAIYDASHNGFLTEQTRALHRRLRPYRRLQLRVRNRIRSSFEEHEAVVEAILSGDGERAGEVLRGHIVVQGDRFTDLIASLDSLAVGGAA
jgi:DNA-binding GntR family transcriptional regulator